jgi:predicted RNA-binding protein YlxR (DUF448 family)
MLAGAVDQELDFGPRTVKPGSARMCAVTREVRPTEQLIRFVVGPDETVVPDLKHRLPGRGVWISASREVLAKAVKAGAFAKGFRRAVKAPPDLVATTEGLLIKSTVEALAIAGKAGQVLAGYAKVENCLRSGEARALIHASNGAPDGVRKLDSLLPAADGAETARIPIVNSLSSAELDLALNRANVIHAALLAGPAGDTFLSRAERLARFRTSGAGANASETATTKTRANAFRD